MIFAAVSLLIFTNIVIAENQRTIANPNVNTEVRSTEDKVNDSSDFTSINPGDNAAKMSSVSSRDKNKNVITQVTGAVQLQSNNKNVKSNNKDVVKKYNRFSKIQGVKKNKKSM
jgi:hypothetical protein